MKLIDMLIMVVGDLENAVYGNTLEQMAEFERKDARNKLREEIMGKFGYGFRYTGVNEGHWELLPSTKSINNLDKGK